MPRKPKYYTLDKIKQTDSRYRILLGERANGKSFAVKYECIKQAYNNINDGNGKFIYLRRWREDIKAASVEAYFSDLIQDANGKNRIIEITGGKFESVMAFQGKIYFCNLDENMTRVRDKRVIGRYCALNEDERYKSQAFVGYDNIIFEEFITNKIYLTNECARLQNFVSTVLRHRAGIVYMIGNTLSRVCPYFYEWCLDGVLRQAIGTIDIYHFNTTDGVINIAVERCASAQAENKMYFGKAEKQIVSGEWEVNDVAHLPRKHDEYEKLYEVLVKYQNFKFVLELLLEPIDGGVLCFVYPLTSDRYIERQISDVFSDLPNITYRLDMRRKPERLINDCFRMGNVCYSDNLTGADFTNVNKYFHIGVLVN